MPSLFQTGVTVKHVAQIRDKSSVRVDSREQGSAMDSKDVLESLDRDEFLAKRLQRQPIGLLANSSSKAYSQQDKESDQGKENHNQDYHDRFCFECNRSLAKSPHLINIAGRLHKWHPECFKCHICDHPMDRETSCHVYKDKIVCKEDYAKLQRDNSTKCSRCRWPIGASDWVRKAGEYVYHLACFSCDICLRQLSTGEQFTINIQEKSAVKLLCRLHFAIENQSQLESEATMVTQNAVTDSSNNALATERPPTSPSTTFDYSYGRLYCSSVASSKQFQPQSQEQYLHLMASTSGAGSSGPSGQALMLDAAQKPAFDDAAGLVHQLADDVNQSAALRAGASTSSSSGSASGMLGGMPSKSKRVRTTFTEDQLSILQTHFQIDSNPDGQDLERIATITGLSKRVTQVWFQNSRARQKKYMIKRKPSSSSTNSGPSMHQFGHHSRSHHHHAHHIGALDGAGMAELGYRSDLSPCGLVSHVDDMDDTHSSDDEQLAVSDDSDQ